MRVVPGALIACAFTLGIAIAQTSSDDAYASLWLYQGSWKSVSMEAAAVSGSAKAVKRDEIKNDCQRIGTYFACQQTVNGKIGSLIVFVPAKEKGHYFTQAVLPEGWAAGRGALEIEGDRWIYSGKDEEKGKTTYYRTTNVFTGKNRIHFEQAESADGKHWKVTSSGDEERMNG